MITVSIVDDDSNLCLILTKALCRGTRFEVISTHPTAEAALFEIPLRKPDVVLMDIKLPGISGIECIRRLRRIHPPVPSRVIILSGHHDEALIFEALKAGADGYLSKNDISTPHLCESIQQVLSGGAPISPNIARKVLEHFRRPVSPLVNLSNRESEVLDKLSDGLMYKEIASVLSISLNTVRRHVGSIYDKLHVQSRSQAAARYHQQKDASGSSLGGHA